MEIGSSSGEGYTINLKKTPKVKTSAELKELYSSTIDSIANINSLKDTAKVRMTKEIREAINEYKERFGYKSE